MKTKGVLAFLLALALVFSMVSAAFAASEEAIDAADKLHVLGLFQGKGTNEDGTPNYDLDAAPTRNEAVTMLVRLLGKEEEAKAGIWDLPFADLSEWAKPYVGYAYANGLTKGTGETTFGGGSLVTASQYLTFILRALGYDSSTDFKWNAAWELSDKMGITHGEYDADSDFNRGDVALISVSALQAVLKDGTQTLAEKLITEGVFTKEQYTEAVIGISKPGVIQIWDGSIADSFAGGNGMESDPYLIETGAQLAFFQDILCEKPTYFRLSGDIMLNDASDWENWDTQPPANVWTAKALYNKSLDGDGKTIIGLYTAPGESYHGLFSGINSGSITNLSVIQSCVLGTDHCAGIVSVIQDDHVLIENCQFDGRVLASGAFVGGIAAEVTAEGADKDIRIRDCINYGMIEVASPSAGPYDVYAGGIVGGLGKGTHVYGCKNYGAVSAAIHSAGGIVGHAFSGAVIEMCANFGTVAQQQLDKDNTLTACGGIAGSLYDNASVLASANYGSVTGFERVGGIAGAMGQDSSILQCINVGPVSGKMQTAGIVGYVFSNGSVYNSVNTASVYGEQKTDALAGEGTFEGNSLFYLSGAWKTPSRVADSKALTESELQSSEFVAELNHWVEQNQTFDLKFRYWAPGTEETAYLPTFEAEKMFVSVPDEPGPDVSPTVLFLSETTKILDTVGNVVRTIPAYSACLVNIPGNSSNYTYVLEDVTGSDARLVEECSGGFGEFVPSMCELLIGLWSEELLETGRRYRLTIKYVNQRGELMGKEAVYEFEYPVGSIGPAGPIPENVHWNEKGLPSWKAGEELQNPVYFIYVQFDNQLRRDRQESSQIGTMAFMYFATSSELNLSENMEAFKVQGGEGAVYRFRVKAFSMRISDRNHSLWSDWSEWSPLT